MPATNNPVDDLVTLYDMQREYSLSYADRRWLERHLWHLAVEQVGPKPYLYPRAAAIRMLGVRWQGRTLDIGVFGGSNDLAWCRCGRTFVDAAGLVAHVKREHGCVPPEQAERSPNYRISWQELKASVQAELKGATK